MSRLRIRIELSRGGFGVPLHKLAGVFCETQKFLQLLTEDVGIPQGTGEWVGFDFDQASLDFTAEYVGPVTADQVLAFNASFDGATSIRRDTIAQFARITEAIGQEDVIGFGLYPTGDAPEPVEWRCLSRRFALRIEEEIQTLLSPGGGQDSHLPAVQDSGREARLFRDRRERSAESANWMEHMRSVETTLTNRIQGVENRVDQHAGQITKLQGESASIEDSVRSLITSIETFCNQAGRQLEHNTPLALPAPASIEKARPVWWYVGVAGAALAVAIAIVSLVPWLGGSASRASRVEPPKSTPEQTEVSFHRTNPPPPVPTSATRSTADRSAVPPAAPPQKAAVSAPAVPTAATPPAPLDAPMRVELEATDPAWVSLLDAEKKPLFVGLASPGTTRTIDLTTAARLRTGNAGGLIVRVNGQSIGTLGPSGSVREVEFNNSGYRIIATETPER